MDDGSKCMIIVAYKRSDGCHCDCGDTTLEVRLFTESSRMQVIGARSQQRPCMAQSHAGHGRRRDGDGDSDNDGDGWVRRARPARARCG